MELVNLIVEELSTPKLKRVKKQLSLASDELSEKLHDINHSIGLIDDTIASRGNGSSSDGDDAEGE